jgi:phosphoribosylaminoimidazole-succinocarboxamide synthase
MPNPIPGKGELLTKMSVFWFDMIARESERPGSPLRGLRHHLLSTDPQDVEGLSREDASVLRGRVMIGRRCRVVPIECVVRGYLAGSGWKEYREKQAVCGVSLPAGLRQSEKLPQPIFTPATKEATGHDENITFERACAIAGRGLMTTLRDRAIALYTMAHDYALRRGIIVADTKFEFGIPLDENDENPILIDEALTPDSSRFWPASEYAVGRDQPSFDKQYVRDYLQALVDNGRWNKEAPGPELPDEVVTNTQAKYLEAYERLTGGR